MPTSAKFIFSVGGNSEKKMSIDRSNGIKIMEERSWPSLENMFEACSGSNDV